jgi:Amt family ammonium transporter
MFVLISWLNSDYIAHLDGFSEIPGGWLNGHYIQLAYQLADCVSGFAYSFFGTCIILFVMNLIPGLSLRASEEAEENGIDEYEMGEFAVSLIQTLLAVRHTDMFFSSTITLSFDVSCQ